MTQNVSPYAVYSRLGLPNTPWLIDVRPRDVVAHARIIPGARSVDEACVAQWSARAPSTQPVVVCCETGGERSRGCAQTLAKLGVRADVLEGGLAAWQAAGYATIQARPDLRAPGASLWVTRERPKIDRLACPWLVRRFIDPDAQFFYTAAHRVRSQAEALDAQPFDIADVTFSHRGPKCSFDAFLAEFDLRDPVLDEVARIVRAADTAELSQSPQAHGLLAISLGLSANVTDDVLLLEQAMPLYDALYAWCKTARRETHSWPQKGY